MSADLTQDYEPRFSGFHDLMEYRVREILLVSSLYDAFVLEEDGRLAEKIMGEYVELQLRFIPRITRVSDADDALRAMEEGDIDLVILTTHIPDIDPLRFAAKIKEMDPEKPVILLTYEPVDVNILKELRKLPGISKAFYWSGDNTLLLAMIKYVEDFFNTANDTLSGVQVILVIEDSPRYYSIFLPLIYTEIMAQTKELISDGVNELHRQLRARARPKILLAETYEEALEVYERYKSHLLGVISDIRFPREDALDLEAGFKIARKIQEEILDLPVILQSSNPDVQEICEREGQLFLNKNSDNLLQDLRTFVLHHFGFGSFVFRSPDGKEIARADNLREFLEKIKDVPAESIIYHGRRNHFSRWFRARTEFEPAEQLRPRRITDFEDADDIRDYIITTIRRSVDLSQHGVIKDFRPRQSDPDQAFVKLGSGSLGGKARGIAFINALLSDREMQNNYPGIKIVIPTTYVLCSDIFENFLRKNSLEGFVYSDVSDRELAERFLEAKMPESTVKDLRSLLERIDYPVAVRSSSLLEDSQALPFAGIYKTYMLPNNSTDIKTRLEQLCSAVKLVYASTFFRSPKEYIRNTDYRIEEERMAVIIQQTAGDIHDGIFYPVISGVARSYNFYPYSHMDPEDGVICMALGLGRMIVGNEKVYQFSPRYPKMNPPYADAEEFIENSQREFYALNMEEPEIKVRYNEDFSLVRKGLARAEKDGTLRMVASTYSFEDGRIRDTTAAEGTRVATFAPILKYDEIALSDLLKDLLEVGENAFATPVEMEFALNHSPEEKKADFYFLQIRPMVVGNEFIDARPENYDDVEVAAFTSKAMGNGIYDDITDIVYIDREKFDVTKTRIIAGEIETINKRLTAEDRSCLLIGFGRWATSDPSLGIPCQWHQISRAEIFMEISSEKLRVEPSQGSHFFHNMLSLGLGYMYIDEGKKDHRIDWEWIESLHLRGKTEYLKHVRLDSPLRIKIDGRSSSGVVLKPSASK